MNRKAFTLLELIIAITILVIISIVAIPNILNAIKGARENTLLYNLYSIRKAISRYHAENKAYPRSLDALHIEGYLPQLPIDPTTGKADWEIAINYWVEVDVGGHFEGDFVDGWVIDPVTSDFATADFIVPLDYGEPYFDEQVMGKEVYRSAKGVRNVRSRNRIVVTSSTPAGSSLRDPDHNTLGRPLYQFWKINPERDDPTDTDFWPHFLIEKDFLEFPVSGPVPDEINFPEDNYIFDKQAGNYQFNNTNTLETLKNVAHDVVLAGEGDYFE